MRGSYSGKKADVTFRGRWNQLRQVIDKIRWSRRWIPAIMPASALATTH